MMRILIWAWCLTWGFFCILWFVQGLRDLRERRKHGDN